MNRALRRLACAALFAVATSDSSVRAADESWVEVKSPHVTVMSDAGEETARAIAWQIEQLHSVIHRTSPWARAGVSPPARTIAPRDAAGVRVFVPTYQDGPNAAGSVTAMFNLDASYAVLRADLSNAWPGSQPYFTWFHAYASRLTQPNVRRTSPAWFNRGVPAAFANLRFTSDGLIVGQPTPYYLRGLSAGGERLTLRELLNTGAQSPRIATGSPQLPSFDGQAWAFASFLLFADNGAHRAMLNRFVAHWIDGVAEPLIYEQAFGNLETLETAFRRYVDAGTFASTTVAIDADVKRDAFEVRSLTPARVKATEGLFLVASQRLAEARAAAAQARELAPDLPEPYEVDGLVADRERRPDAARAAYRNAVDRGSTSSYVHARLGNIHVNDYVQSGTANRDALAEAARLQARAVALDPNHTLLNAQLAQTYLFMNSAFEALSAAQRAADTAPNDAEPHLLLARAHNMLRSRDTALEEANEALRLAKTEIERSEARALITQFSR